MKEIVRLFPIELKQKIISKTHHKWDTLQEIRLRLGQPIELIFDQDVEWIRESRPTPQDYMFILNQLSEFSLYRMEDELREGYITIEGGHRVGLAGKVNTLKGSVKAIQHITFLNIRIAKESIGAAIPILPFLYKENYFNTLIVGPPLTGKTTLIRDLTRLIASGWNKVEPKKVGVIDERSEIAASIKGVPQHDVGLRADVMDACPKSEGMMMLIRSMSPEIVVVDEIGSSEDVQALMEAIHAGVTIICTIHGNTIDELKKRPSLQPLFHEQVFQRIIVLEKSTVPGKIKQIYDHDGTDLYLKSRCLQNEVDWSASFHRHNDMGRI